MKHIFSFFFGEKSFYTGEGYCPNRYGLLSVCLVITPAPSPPLPSKVKDILTVQDILCWIHCSNKHMIFILYLFFKYCYCLYNRILKFLLYLRLLLTLEIGKNAKTVAMHFYKFSHFIKQLLLFVKPTIFGTGFIILFSQLIKKIKLLGKRKK